MNVIGEKSPVRVNVTIAYESLCPDSKRFFHKQFVPTFNRLSNYMNVKFLPFGNELISRLPSKVKFECQHGPNECYRNKIQACFIAYDGNTTNQVKFINCAFDVKKAKKHVENCFDDENFHSKIKHCADGIMGDELLLKTGLETPAHSFIPWIVINGKSGKNFNKRAFEHFMNVICDELRADKPDECK
ncbi:gamma-interferon-inducible lysosomal thiol reductase-like isoform X2 [Parasteatoda tepidariorum]|uniref:gamma-interferon-inducible lysosomal thiol reductase-like isoform X2 n=1 Tax=Parasteatoda tepidariorum TaxID=114398 RepID=UPI00077FC9CA